MWFKAPVLKEMEHLGLLVYLDVQHIKPSASIIYVPVGSGIVASIVRVLVMGRDTGSRQNRA
jgi:hypothetical protein